MCIEIYYNVLELADINDNNKKKKRRSNMIK